MKKTSIWVYILIGIIIEYIAYLLAGAWEKDITIFIFVENLTAVMQKPFGWYFNIYTPIFLLIGAGVVFMIYLNDKSKQRFMPGKEYGTAQWGNVEKITKRFADRDDSHNNRIYSNGLRISLNSKKTRINNNTFIIGGSGAGKSLFEVRPNLFQANASYVVTDPKGELLADTAYYMKEQGYIVKVLNLINMKESDCYNPFEYLKEQSDVPRLITNLIANTTPKGANSSDPFWEKAESMLLQALFFYVWLECPSTERNMNKVLDLLAMAEFDEEGNDTELDILMDALPDGHPAKINYNRVMRGAGDTVRSIIISANARLAPFDNPDLRRIFSRDDFDIGTLGTGKDLDGKTKTIIYCVIPDEDTTYNFVPGMLYTQMFRELYYLADQVYHGELPVAVTFVLDEFANIALPHNFLSLLSTIRSRNLSAIVIIQNMAQIKAMYKDDWESIPGNCDVMVYLGGNEKSTFEYISDVLGDGTIYKKSSSVSRGTHGSSSQSTDTVGRKLMTPEEVKHLDNSKCLVFVRGQYPVLDLKYQTFHAEEYVHAKELGIYRHAPLPVFSEDEIKTLSPEELAEYEASQKEYPDKIKITTMTLEEIQSVLEQTESKKSIHREHPVLSIDWDKYDTLELLLRRETLSENQQALLQKAVMAGLTDGQVLSVLKNEQSAQQYITAYQKANGFLG